MEEPTIPFVRKANCTTQMLLETRRGLAGVSLLPFAGVATEREGRVLPSSITSSAHLIPTMSDLAPRQSLKGSSGMPSRMDVKLVASVWRMVVQTRVSLIEANATTVPRKRHTKVPARISWPGPNLDLRCLTPTQENQ